MSDSLPPIPPDQTPWRNITFRVMFKEANRANLPINLIERINNLIVNAFEEEFDNGLIDLTHDEGEDDYTTNRKVIDTDNRDETTTELVLDNGERVTVDPVELFFNMVENLPRDDPDYDTSSLDAWHDKLKDLYPK